MGAVHFNKHTKIKGHWILQHTYRIKTLQASLWLETWCIDHNTFWGGKCVPKYSQWWEVHCIFFFFLARQRINSLTWIFMTAQSANFIMSENVLENTVWRVLWKGVLIDWLLLVSSIFCGVSDFSFDYEW